jgi:hypothetical protein
LQDGRPSISRHVTLNTGFSNIFGETLKKVEKYFFQDWPKFEVEADEKQNIFFYLT